MSSNNILIRADSSSTIGTGHIMRDLVLARQYKDATIFFAVQDLQGNINYKIKEFGFQEVLLQNNSIEMLNSIIRELKIDLLIIDHYDLDYDFEKAIKTQNPKLLLMVLDDTYEKHYCDILLNHNISANTNKYKKKVPMNCKLCCGSKYTLLRDEFYKEKKKLKKKKDSYKKTIFIAMGGADTAKLNIPLLKILNKFSKIRVHLVTTTANNDLQKLKNYCKNKKWINLYINSKYLAKLMSQSDLAIVTPSVTVNEVYFMEIPLIAIKTADNQQELYNYLKRKRYLTLEKFHAQKIYQAIQKSINV